MSLSSNDTVPSQEKMRPQTSERFEALMAKHRERFASIKSKIGSGASKPTSDPFKVNRPQYDAEGQTLVQRSLDNQMPCYEFHIFIEADSQMKGPRAFVILMAMKTLGTVLFSTPTIADIQAEKAIADEVVVTLETVTPLEKITEEASALAEVASVKMLNLAEVGLP